MYKLNSPNSIAFIVETYVPADDFLAMLRMSIDIPGLLFDFGNYLTIK